MPLQSVRLYLSSVAAVMRFNAVMVSGIVGQVYYLTVDGSDPNSRGRVTVQMVVESIGDAPANETCNC